MQVLPLSFISGKNLKHKEVKGLDLIARECQDQNQSSDLLIHFCLPLGLS